MGQVFWLNIQIAVFVFTVIISTLVRKTDLGNGKYLNILALVQAIERNIKIL